MKANSDNINSSKKKFYTKCNREFYKSSTAAVTGYEYNLNDDKCKLCPFTITTIRYRDNKRTEINECRAGELKPNLNNDYATNSNSDLTNLHIYSLNWNWIEIIRRDVLNMEGVEGVGYNQDLNDCRKCLSISFLKNKKGLAAKNNIIQKYFTLGGEDTMANKNLQKNENELNKSTRQGIFSTLNQLDEVSSMTVEDIDIKLLKPSELNFYSIVGIDDMVESIKDVGVIEPLVVEQLVENRTIVYKILSGERRYRASLAAEKETVPCIVLQGLDEYGRRMIIFEANRQREKTEKDKREEVFFWVEYFKDQKANGVDIPGRIKKLVGEKTDMSDTNAQRYMNLQKLIPELVESFDNKEISLVEAQDIAKMPEDEQIEYYNELQVKLQQPKDKKEKKPLKANTDTVDKKSRNISETIKGKATESVSSSLVEAEMPSKEKLDIVENIMLYLVDRIQSLTSIKTNPEFPFVKDKIDELELIQNFIRHSIYPEYAPEEMQYYFKKFDDFKKILKK